MRKETQQKAAQFVQEKRVALFTVEEEEVHAEVRGIHASYHVTFNPADQWVCTCPAGEHGYNCSHVQAVVLEILRRHDEEEAIV